MSARPFDRAAVALAVLTAAAFFVTGCSLPGIGDDGSSSSSKEQEPAKSEPVESVLVVDGKEAGSSRRSTSGRRRASAATTARRTAADEPRQQEWLPLPLLADGTIDDGPDPFEGEFVPVQALPIEDDPYATSTIERAAAQLRRVDVERWNEWMANGVGSPWDFRSDPIAASMVEVTVERCGGARSVASGVVLADQTVVTTAHAVENAAKRVRIAPANGADARIPAMIRYLDMDDDVAVLRVPGLRTEPLGWHAPASTDPILAYAFGVGPGGRAGTLRRVPVVTSQREQSLTVEQPDALAEQITDRGVQTIVGGITTGFSGGIVAATNDPGMRGGWGFHGLVRARVPFRADTAGVVVPSRIVDEDMDAEERLDEWFEIRPGGCPQWHR